jgi:hypothetical protein
MFCAHCWEFSSLLDDSFCIYCDIRSFPLFTFNVFPQKIMTSLFNYFFSFDAFRHQPLALPSASASGGNCSTRLFVFPVCWVGSRAGWASCGCPRCPKPNKSSLPNFVDGGEKVTASLPNRAVHDKKTRRRTVLLTYMHVDRSSLVLRSTIWFFCDACHKLEVDIILLSA